MPDEFDPYKPGTGLKDDFDGTIVDSNFTTDPQTGRCSLILMVQADDGDEVPQRYGCGSDWDTFDGGETVRHPKGERTLFSNQTAYSDFMVHAMEAGAREVMYQRLRDGLGPRAAANWHGLKFHWEVLPRPTRTRNDETGEWENTTINRTLPTKFLGADGQGTLPVDGTVAAAPSADPLSGVDPVIKAKVVKAAKESDSYTAFIDAMLGLSDGDGTPIMEIPEIGQAVADEDWYNRLHNS